ncbi:MAG: T9SS type A sorting domain-containing protein [Ignavibacteria bacterium]|nr:T9SS type A sorting domain-containing protein [Ignavibacteria bacterium]
MRKSLIHLVCLFILMLSGTVFSANERFRSINTGDWNSTGTWEMSTNNGGTWIAATSTPSDTSGLINVRNLNTVIVTANVNADQLTVENGGTLSINTNIILTMLGGAGDDFTVLSGGTVNGPGTVRTQGTVVLNIRNGSSFNAPLIVNTGNTTASDQSGPFIARFYGTITVDNGATLSVQNGGYAIEAYSDVLNNGTIEGASGADFVIKGTSLINIGAITTQNLIMDTTTSVSGSGSFTSNLISISASGNVSILNNITFSPITNFSISNGGVLNPNTHTFTFNSGTFTVLSGGTVLNSGMVMTQDTVTFNLRSGSSFNAPLKVNSGITRASDQTSPFIARFYGAIIVDIGATLQVQNGGYTIEAYSDVVNNGLISGTSGADFVLVGPSLINNNAITTNNFRMDSTSTISGAGSFTSGAISIGSSGNVTMLSDIIFSPILTFTINNGGILNPNTHTFTFNTGTIVVNNGASVSNSGMVITQDTVSMNLRNGSSFNAPLIVNTGVTTASDNTGPFTARFYGAITVDNGATLSVRNGGYTIEAYSNVINNGTIAGTSGADFVLRGPSLVNNNSITTNNFTMDTTSTISGAGSFTSGAISMGSSGNVTLLSDITFSPLLTFTINNGGILNPNTHTFIFNSGTFTVHNNASVSNSGMVMTQDTVSLNLRDGSTFNAPLNVNSGITTASDQSNPFTARFYGPIDIDSGANFRTQSGGYTVEAHNNVLNNGTIAGTGGGSFRMIGPDLTNNGNISVNNFFFQPGAHTLQGTGFWSTTAEFLSGTVVTLISTHQMRDIDIKAGGTFDITSMKLLLSGNGSPIINNGTFITNGSTIEYNGTVLQAAAIPNVVYHSLTINNAANVSLTTARTVPAVLTLTLGEFTNGANLTLGDGATIVRQDGSLSGVPTFGTTVDVIYIGTNLTNSSFELPASGTVLRDLTINNTGGVTLADARTVNRTLYLTNGTFVNTTNLNMADNITINRNTGILNNLPVFPASVNVIYSGTTDNVATGVELPLSATTLKELTVDKTGGIILTDDITVNDSLKIISGYLNLNGNVITMGTTAYLTETPGNTVRGSSGYLVAVRDLNAPTEVNVAGLGAIFTTTENMGTTEVRRGHTIQTEDTTESIERYYEINPANNTSLNATFGFRYDNSELNGSIASNLILFKSTNDGVNWFSVPGSNNTFINELTAFGVNSFSRWTAGDSLTSLPVELASFTSSIDNRNVELNWSTTAEVNNSGFEIERTTEGNEQWQKIGFVEGNGTTNSPKDFSFTDRNLNTGKYNYRLKQIDYNGSFEYYSLQNLVEIGVPAEFKISQNYPNPFNPTTKIDFALPSDGNVRISLYDMTGREVAVMLNESRPAGYYTVNFNASDLSTGSYFYRVTAESGGQSFVLTKKMTLIK